MHHVCLHPTDVLAPFAIYTFFTSSIHLSEKPNDFCISYMYQEYMHFFYPSGEEKRKENCIENRSGLISFAA